MDKQSMRMDDSRWAHDMRPTPTRPPYGERMMKWFDYDHVQRIVVIVGLAVVFGL